MAIHSNLLPSKIYLQDYSGDYTRFIDAVYKVFEKDFVKYHPYFGKYRLGLKYHPKFQDRAYTFYHMILKVKEYQICEDVNVCLGENLL